MTGAYGHNEEEISACMSLGGLVVAVLIVMGLSCRLFATERARQTLDSLLPTSLTSRQLLVQNSAGINRIILILLIPIALFGDGGSGSGNDHWGLPPGELHIVQRPRTSGPIPPG